MNVFIKLARILLSYWEVVSEYENDINMSGTKNSEGWVLPFPDLQNGGKGREREKRKHIPAGSKQIGSLKGHLFPWSPEARSSNHWK